MAECAEVGTVRLVPLAEEQKNKLMEKGDFKEEDKWSRGVCVPLPLNTLPSSIILSTFNISWTVIAEELLYKIS